MNINCMGRVNVPTPGTPVSLTSNTTLAACKVLFQAIPGLTGKTYVGTTGMITSNLSGVARVLAPNPANGFSETFYVESQDGTNSIRLKDYAIDASVAGEGLLVTYWQE